MARKDSPIEEPEWLQDQYNNAPPDYIPDDMSSWDVVEPTNTQPLSASVASHTALPDDVDVPLEELSREQLLQKITALQQRIHAQQEYIDQQHAILTNRNMTPGDRIMMAVTTKLYPDEVLSGKPFQINVGKLTAEAGVNKDTASSFFPNLESAGGCKYTWTPDGRNEKNQFTSASTIQFLPGNALVNTKQAPARLKQNEAAKTQREVANQTKLQVIACPHCGDEDNSQTALVPICGKCDQPRVAQGTDVLKVPTSQVRIQEDDPVSIVDSVPPPAQVETPPRSQSANEPALSSLADVRKFLDACRKKKFILQPGEFGTRINVPKGTSDAEYEKAIHYIDANEPAIRQLLKEAK